MGCLEGAPLGATEIVSVLDCLLVWKRVPSHGLLQVDGKQDEYQTKTGRPSRFILGEINALEYCKLVLTANWLKKYTYLRRT